MAALRLNSIFSQIFELQRFFDLSDDCDYVIPQKPERKPLEGDALFRAVCTHFCCQKLMFHRVKHSVFITECKPAEQQNNSPSLFLPDFEITVYSKITDLKKKFSAIFYKNASYFYALQQ